MTLGNRASIATLLCLAATLGCGEARNQRCKDVCQKESDCAEERTEKGETSIPYDLEECTAACVSLERSKHGKELVDRHVECAQKSGDDCRALLSCR